MSYQQVVKERAQRIVSALERDIENRAGLGNEWDAIDEEIKDEIRMSWVALIETELHGGL